MKLDDILATIQETLAANKAPADLFTKIQEDLVAAQKEEKENKEPAQKSKKEYVVLLPDSKLSEPTPAFVFQVESGANPTGIFDRLKRVAQAFNESRKGRKAPVRALGELAEFVPARFFKTTDGSKLAIKNKQQTYAVPVSNKLF